MPTVFRERGYQFFFVSSDAAEPMHIHVAKGGDLCKIWLSNRKIAYNHGFRNHQLREIQRLVRAHQVLIQQQWKAYFGE